MRKDAITLERIKLLHPKLREEADLIYSDICEALTGKAICRFSHTLRTFKEQDVLYAKGRTAPGPIVTHAKSGSSMHNYGLAIDVVLLLDRDGDGKHTEVSWDTKGDFDADGVADWMEVVRIFKEFGWTWGGNWRFYDAPHFEKPMGHSVRQLLNLYNKKRVDENNYVLI